MPSTVRRPTIVAIPARGEARKERPIAIKMSIRTTILTAQTLTFTLSTSKTLLKLALNIGFIESMLEYVVATGGGLCISFHWLISS